MSQLLGNINSIIRIFNKYAETDGDCMTLSKGELKQLIQKEFAEVIVNPYNPETIETVFQLLDTDCDSKVDFEEFTILVFKVAKACYKKVQKCQAPAGGQSAKAGSGTTQQAVQVSSRDMNCQFTQEAEKAPNGRSRCSSQEQKPEPLKSEECASGQMNPAPTREEDPSCQTSQKPSVTQPVQRKAEEHQIAKQEPACQGTRMEWKAERGHTWPVQQESSTVVDGAIHQCPQEHLMPDEEPSQQPQQSTTQRPSHPCQMEEQGHTDQEKVELQTPKEKLTIQQHTQTLSQRQTQERERREQDVATTKPQGSQEALQRSTLRQVQECQASEQRSTHWPIQDPQANWSLSGHQEERPLTSEQCPTCQQEQRPQVGERPTWQQQSKPQTQEQGPTCKLEDDPQVGQVDVSSQQPTKEAQGPGRAQNWRQDHESLTLGHHLTGQQECWPQGPEQTPTGQQGQEPQAPGQATTSHYECQSLTPEQHRPHQEEQKLQKPGQSQFRCHECQPLSPEHSTSPEEDRRPRVPERGQSCEPTEIRGPRESSARQPFRTSWSQQPHKPLQFPTPWSSKQ